MGFLSSIFGGGGTVGATPQEQQVASMALSQWQDYQRRWLPLQDHYASVVMDMGKSDSWQRQEAEGKGNVDTATAFSRASQMRTSSEAARGIQVGSSRFNLGVTGSAASEAEARGFAVTTGNEAIDKAWLANLKTASAPGQVLAGSAMQGAATGAETASRIAISNAQEQNAVTASKYGALGFGIGMLGSPQGMKAMGIGPNAPGGSFPGGGSGILDFQNNLSPAGATGIPYGPE